MKIGDAKVYKPQGHWSEADLPPEMRPPKSPEDFQRMEQELAEGKVPQFALTFLPSHYERTGQVEKLYALYISHGHLMPQSKEKSAYLLEKKFNETGALSEVELKELELTAYDFTRHLYLGRWPDQETPEQLFAMIHVTEFFQHASKNGHKEDVPPLQSALDKAEKYDPKCGLLLLAKFRAAVREEKSQRAAQNRRETAEAEQEVRALYSQLIALGEQNSLWKHLRVEARRRASYQLRGPSQISTPETRAEKARLDAEEHQRYQDSMDDQKRLDALRLQIAAEVWPETRPQMPANVLKFKRKWYHHPKIALPYLILTGQIFAILWHVFRHKQREKKNQARRR
jgi:hypothetical protein